MRRALLFLAWSCICSVSGALGCHLWLGHQYDKLAVMYRLKADEATDWKVQTIRLRADNAVLRAKALEDR